MNWVVLQYAMQAIKRRWCSSSITVFWWWCHSGTTVMSWNSLYLLCWRQCTQNLLLFFLDNMMGTRSSGGWVLNFFRVSFKNLFSPISLLVFVLLICVAADVKSSNRNILHPNILHFCLLIDSLHMRCVMALKYTCVSLGSSGRMNRLFVRLTHRWMQMMLCLPNM